MIYFVGFYFVFLSLSFPLVSGTQQLMHFDPGCHSHIVESFFVYPSLLPVFSIISFNCRRCICCPLFHRSNVSSCNKPIRSFKKVCTITWQFPIIDIKILAQFTSFFSHMIFIAAFSFYSHYSTPLFVACDTIFQ